MLAIRLNRTGKRNQAHFRVVVQEHTKAPGKRHVEIVGSVDPRKKTIILKKERILYWIGQGAQVSDAVHNVLVREGVIDAKKIAKKMPRPVAKETPAETPVEAPVASVEEANTETIPTIDTTFPQAEATVAEAVVPEASQVDQIVTDGVFATKEK